MTKKIASLIGVVLLVAGIIGASILYNSLKSGYEEGNKQSSNPAAVSGGKSSPAPAPSKEEPILSPDFSLQDEQGNTVKLSDYFGKPIVINFWASWCPPCKAEMPDFQTLFDEKGEEITFLMVNLTDGGRETLEKATAFIEKNEYTFPVLFDVSQEATMSYGISSIPTTVFLDSQGYIFSGHIGAISEDALRTQIERLLQQDSEKA